MEGIRLLSEARHSSPRLVHVRSEAFSLKDDRDDLIQASERAQTSLIRSVEALDAWGVKSETAQKVF